MKNCRCKLSTSRVILLSFMATIIMGSLLLSLPVSSADGVAVPYVDALFTATTSTCVTGLVVTPTFNSWSIFGQIIILILIQIGGLGVITVMSAMMIFIRRKMGIEDRILLQDAFNLNSMSGIVKFVKQVVTGTFIIEGIGAAVYMVAFVPQFGPRGIWISIFTAVSAFCNAGLDIISENSLCDFALNPLVNIVTVLLIILGGIGYVVWWDVLRVLKQKNCKRKIRALSLHSKIAISTSLFLIIFGTVCFFVFEYNNPETIKDYSLIEKIEVSLFQSVTTRTAGFATIPQENLTNASSAVALLLMFIGGSPVGTAGGIKTVTFTVLVWSAISQIKNKNSVSVFNRTLTTIAVNKAVAVAIMSLFTVFLSTVLLAAVTQADMLDIIFEAVSATATVGLTRNLTSSLNLIGKIIIIATMYFGRVGPISLAVAFLAKRKNNNKIINPTEEICVG